MLLHKCQSLYMSLTLVINFGTILSSKALILQSFIIHIKLLHHVVVELVPTSPSTATKRQRKTKRSEDKGGERESIRKSQILLYLIIIYYINTENLAHSAYLVVVIVQKSKLTISKIYSKVN